MSLTRQAVLVVRHQSVCSHAVARFIVSCVYSNRQYAACCGPWDSGSSYSKGPRLELADHRQAFAESVSPQVKAD